MPSGLLTFFTALAFGASLLGTTVPADTRVDHYEVILLPYELHWSELELRQAEVDATLHSADSVKWSQTEVRISWNTQCEVSYYAYVTLPELVDWETAPAALAVEFDRLRISAEVYEAFSVEIGAIFASLAHDLECGFDGLEVLANEAISDWRETSLSGKVHGVELWREYELLLVQ